MPAGSELQGRAGRDEVLVGLVAEELGELGRLPAEGGATSPRTEGEGSMRHRNRRAAHGQGTRALACWEPRRSAELTPHNTWRENDIRRRLGYSIRPCEVPQVQVVSPARSWGVKSRRMACTRSVRQCNTGAGASPMPGPRRSVEMTQHNARCRDDMPRDRRRAICLFAVLQVQLLSLARSLRFTEEELNNSRNSAAPGQLTDPAVPS
jgi:hypothetical protein